MIFSARGRKLVYFALTGDILAKEFHKKQDTRLVDWKTTMRSYCVYELLDDGTRHFDLGARRTQNYFKLSFEFVSVGKDHLVTMGGNSSSNQREGVQAGVRDGRVVQLSRSRTPFPSWSRGGWNGGIYQVVGAGAVMYESREVPTALRQQLGSGSISFEDNYATITFNRNDGSLTQYFQGY